MPYKRLTYKQRIQLETLYNQNHSVSFIAMELGVHRSTVYREISRGIYSRLKTDYTTYQTYSADKGQAYAKFHRTTVGAQLKIGKDHKFAQFIAKMVKQKYSPAAILFYIEKHHLHFETHISKATLYNYINNNIIYGVSSKHLPRHGKIKKKIMVQRERKQPLQGISIEQRPQSVYQRLEFGHWEIDTVIGKRAKGDILLVLTERKTRYEIIRRIPSKEAKSVEAEIIKLQSVFGVHFSKVFKSFTCDNGCEFKTLHKMPIAVYYCHPYSSWERGSNENQNAFIRRFIPKSTPIEEYTDDYIKATQDYINEYPRAIFDGKSSQQMAENELKSLNIEHIMNFL